MLVIVLFSAEGGVGGGGGGDEASLRTWSINCGDEEIVVFGLIRYTRIQVVVKSVRGPPC